jgi:hypothetical protein
MAKSAGHSSSGNGSGNGAQAMAGQGSGHGHGHGGASYHSREGGDDGSRGGVTPQQFYTHSLSALKGNGVVPGTYAQPGGGEYGGGALNSGSNMTSSSPFDYNVQWNQQHGADGGQQGPPQYVYQYTDQPPHPQQQPQPQQPQQQRSSPRDAMPGDGYLQHY